MRLSAGSGKTSMRSIIFANYLGTVFNTLDCGAHRDAVQLATPCVWARRVSASFAACAFRLILAGLAAVGVENSHVRFLGNLVLNLWDCGGQDAFMENYFESQKDQIFRNVEGGRPARCLA
jgi:hypothetical protein